MDSKEPICYKKNYIKEVLGRIDFATPLTEFEKALPADFLKIIKNEFPISENTQGTIQNIHIDKGIVKDNLERYTEWTFHGKDRQKSIKVSSKYIVVSLKKYYNYEDFLKDIINPVNSLMKDLGNISIIRTGIRFVNIFDDLIKSYDDLQKYFNNFAVETFKNIYQPDACSRNILISEFLVQDIKLRVQSGIYNSNYPAPISNKEYLIDIDAYYDFPHVISDFKEYFDKLHNQIQSIFEHSISNELRSKLNE
ncbi:TIGR04255 family protein [Leptospira yasudae]|nr:TIGR04255 family protein [Leptospira yasudae]